MENMNDGLSARGMAKAFARGRRHIRKIIMAGDDQPPEAVEVKCDRCGQTVNGILDKHFTAGFYLVEFGSWSKFARQGERRICDGCMHSDPAYIAIYGDLRWHVSNGQS